MFGKRHIISILIFITGFIAVILLAESGNFEKTVPMGPSSSQVNDPLLNESYFSKISFYSTHENMPYLHLNAEELTLNSQTERSVFFSLNGVVFTKNREPVHYKSKRGLVFQKKKVLFLDEEVKVWMENSQLLADKVEYDIAKNKIASTGNVFTETKGKENHEVIMIKSHYAESFPDKSFSRYIGNVQGHVKRSKIYEENIWFAASRMDLDMLSSKITLNENVMIKKQQLKAVSLKGEIFLENYNKNLKYFVLYDDVKVVEKVILEKEGVRSTFDRKAFAEKLEGIMSENKIILTGYPKVFQQSDVIKGNKITLRENNEVVEVDDANTNFIIR